MLFGVPLFLAAYFKLHFFIVKDFADSISITVEYSLVIVSALLLFEEINQPNTVHFIRRFSFVLRLS